jgi:hypothetical protein
LHEELFSGDESTAPTSIPKVKVVKPSSVSIADIDGILAGWEEDFVRDSEKDVLASLTSMFPTLHGKVAAVRAFDNLAVR